MSETVEQSTHDTKNKTVRLGPRTITVPEDWDSVAFEEAIELNPKYTKPDDGPFDYLPMDAVDENKQTIEYWTEREKDDCTTTWFKNGDTVYAKITPCTENGKIAFIEELSTEVGSGSTEFLVFHPQEGVTDERFVYYLANLPDFRSVTISLMEGSTGRQRVPSDVFKKGIKLPLPPLPEQRRIADILSTVDEQIQQTDEVIEKTRELKRGLVQDLLVKQGSKSTQSVRFGPLYVEIPDSWDVTTVNQLSTSRQLGTSERGDPNNDEIPLIKMGNLGIGTWDLSEIENIGRDQEILDKCQLKKGDLLFNTRNSPELVGKTAVWDFEFPAVFDNNLLRIRFNDDVYDSNFINLYLSSALGRNYLQSLVHGTTSVAAIYWKDLKNLKIPLPPKDEQRQIVRLMKVVDSRIATEQIYKQKLQELKRGLMQDLLTGTVRVDPEQA